MGICITSNYKGAPSLYGSCSMLLRIREVVALKWDQEFGEHYQTLRRCYCREDYRAFDKKATEILSVERFNPDDQDMVDFLLSSEDEGKASYKTAKKILDLLKDYTSPNTLAYQYYSNDDWEVFKTLLKGCYSHRANLIWR